MAIMGVPVRITWVIIRSDIPWFVVVDWGGSVVVTRTYVNRALSCTTNQEDQTSKHRQKCQFHTNTYLM